METRFRSSASRYYELTPAQEKQLDQALSENVAWAYTNTCASWATVSEVTGQELDAGELMLTDTPRELIESIRKAERLEPTTPANPQPPPEPRQQGSSTGSLSDTSLSLHQQAIEGVHKLDAAMARQPDQSSERMAASLANLARAQGLERIDHVVVGKPTGPSSDSQNVFVIQGALDDPAHRRAHMGIDAAVHTSVDDSIRQLQQIDRQQAAATVAEPAQVLEEVQHRRLV